MFSLNGTNDFLFIFCLGCYNDRKSFFGLLMRQIEEAQFGVNHGYPNDNVLQVD